jgi:hypothetical protein
VSVSASCLVSMIVVSLCILRMCWFGYFSGGGGAVAVSAAPAAGAGAVAEAPKEEEKKVITALHLQS